MDGLMFSDASSGPMVSLSLLGWNVVCMLLVCQADLQLVQTSLSDTPSRAGSLVDRQSLQRSSISVGSDLHKVTMAIHVSLLSSSCNDAIGLSV